MQTMAASAELHSLDYPGNSGEMVQETSAGSMQWLAILG